MLPLVLVEGGLERVELSCIMRGYNASYGTTPRSGEHFGPHVLY